MLATVAAGDAADVAAAAEAAQRAFPAWRDLPGGERRDLLHGIADAIEARAEEIALLESLDTGQPIRFMSQAAKRGAENFRFFADKAPEADDGLSLPAREHLNYTLRQPIGPVAAITPWNTPFMLSTWKIAPALAAGCTVVHKPAEWSPLTATLLAEIATAAGLPAGVLNTVHGLGETAGKAADRASGDPGHRVRRRVGDRQRDHGAGRADAEARALRARRQEPGRSCSTTPTSIARSTQSCS